MLKFFSFPKWPFYIPNVVLTKTIKHPEIDVLLGDNTSQLIDKLVNAVFDGKTEKLGFLLGKTKSEGIQPIVIIRYFQSYLKILIQVGAAKKSGLSTGAAISNLRPPIYFKRKNAVTHHSSVCSVEWCLALLNRFVLLEKQCNYSFVIFCLITPKSYVLTW